MMLNSSMKILLFLTWLHTTFRYVWIKP